MKYTTLLFAICVSAILSAACGDTGGPANTNTANTNSANTNVTKTNADKPFAVTTPTPDQVTNNAPTLTPVFKSYCAARVKNDEAAIRKHYDRDTLKSFDEQMKEEGIKSLVKFLEDERVTNELCEVSNERITGDRAMGKIKTVAYPNGFDVLFVKENGEWKMSTMNPKAEPKTAK